MVETHPGTVGTEYEHATPTQRRQRSTRLLYDADDAVISEFFAHNTPRSQALRDLIYLFAIEHGNDADVSQRLRAHLVSLAGLGPAGSGNAAAPVAREAAPVAARTRVAEADDPVAGPVAEEADTESDTDSAEVVDGEVVAPAPPVQAEPEPAPAPNPKPAVKNAAAPSTSTADTNTASSGEDPDEEPGVGQQQMSSDFDFAALLSNRRNSRDEQ